MRYNKRVFIHYRRISQVKIKAREIAFAGITGALYAAVTMAIAPIAYGPIQLRFTEAFCVLPFFLPVTAWGLFVGCAIANIVSAAGIIDVIFGSLATLIAALLTARIGKPFRKGAENSFTYLRCLFACAMPVALNTPIVGAILAYTYTPEAFFAGFALFMGEVALGESIVMFTLGLVFIRLLPRTGIMKMVS